VPVAKLLVVTVHVIFVKPAVAAGVAPGQAATGGVSTVVQAPEGPPAPEP